MFSVLPLMVNGEIHKDPNAIATQREARFFFFSSVCQKMRGGKVVKVKKWQQQNILGSIGTPLDHRSVTPRTTGLNFSSIQLTKQFASEVLCKIESGPCTFLSDESRFLPNDRIAHSNSTGLRTCRNIHPF